ncbi:glycoside hydrolase family 30 protein [Marinicrinis sediminis]|uniref:Glycoside hydrolase family 30 beta sandwich domain-containing protein n=1 Tax=Marinicrinis sediminis TaxID=1652465 RepID=A0ABW5RE87_9BACL
MHNKKAKLIQTSKHSNDRLTVKEPLTFQYDEKGLENQLINVYEDVQYQEIVGFGGALTEASAVTINKMSKDKQEEIMCAYFDEENGLGYTFCRTHINSCDFSLGNYAYVEKEDPELKQFDISRDKEALIPLLQQAQTATGDDFKLFASPWSPPAWMKTNGEMNNGGQLIKQYWQTWANYFVKYIQAYAEEGIAMWGLTVQNEANAKQVWDSCMYNAEEEKEFVRDYLGPTLEKHGLSHIKIMIWDHNKERVYDRAKVAFEDEQAAKYIWGIGFHWYSGDHFEALAAVHDRFPDKKLVFTEGCQEGGVHLGAWETGERYGHDIMGNLNNWMTAWTDWNIVLDEQGGPNHVHNYCDAPIIADTNTNTVHYESSYYYIGHFSKYIRPGANRIASTKYTDKLETVAFQQADRTITLVVMNRSEQALPYTIRMRDHIAQSSIPARSIQTIII